MILHWVVVENRHAGLRQFASVLILGQHLDYSVLLVLEVSLPTLQSDRFSLKILISRGLLQMYRQATLGGSALKIMICTMKLLDGRLFYGRGITETFIIKP